MTSLNTNLPDFKIKGISCPMIFVQGGTFDMGSKEMNREKPIHSVTVPSFYMSQYLVTQELYQAVMEKKPSYHKGKHRPVENVSWDEARKFTERLQEITQKEFRLPTESEWEFAARGGVHSQGYAYCGSDELSQVGWYNKNSGGETKPVGLLYPNELGLYDMSGNVYEWCEDDWHEDYDKPNRPDNGNAWVDAPDRGADRVIRGGCYFRRSVACRPAYRYRYQPDDRYDIIGFRLVFSPS